MQPYIGKLIGPSGIAKIIAHENVDPLRGGWVEVTLMPDSQESLDLFIDNESD
ncbi:MAG: hypothetical protein KZQ97_13930 [Candidatus Thiodiazotropha sp. (ex Dulcina madagascariensis)]|nr:hypothetical protein [Candidatus Thiodiazotropha sp. (ex Dulcina madagascariensis)]